MSAPERIYQDPRVLHSVPTEPEDGLVGYVREDIVAQKLAELRETEFVIQFEINSQDDLILGLTNLGQMLQFEPRSGRWIPLEDPGR